MDIGALNLFLSEENIKRHSDYLNTLSLKYSILEKSEPALIGKTMLEISRMRLAQDVKEDALRLLWNINSHKIYFKSFNANPQKSELLLKKYTSRESFLYSLFELAKGRENGFLFVYKDGGGAINVDISDQMGAAFLKWEPLLSIDLYEHAYFSDYLFNKERYLRAALAYLDTGRLI